jgi:hypothetical protein
VQHDAGRLGVGEEHRGDPAEDLVGDQRAGGERDGPETGGLQDAAHVRADAVAVEDLALEAAQHAVAQAALDDRLQRGASASACLRIFSQCAIVAATASSSVSVSAASGFATPSATSTAVPNDPLSLV